MRSKWQNPATAKLSKNLISQMCRLVFGADDYKTAQPLAGGRSHQNYLISLASGQQVVLRVSGNQQSLGKQYALAQKLWLKLPVPRFLSQPQAANGKRFFAFMEFKPGQRLANIEALPVAEQAQLGFELGEYLALIHSQTFKHAGAFSSDLKLDQNYDISPNGLSEIFANCLSQASKNGHIDGKLAQTYRHSFAEKIQILDQWPHHHCLIHADLNEDNILHYDGHISAILDWEFALSGHPALDFGKFTRTPYSHCPIFTENLCDNYYLTHKNLPVNWPEIAQIVDLLAWAEFLSRPQVTEDIKTSALGKLRGNL
ncbi:MAG: aminoglycoside phosphotransferase family protein [Rhizobiales bacterium]|nr:aminoglycoside phosphotransferase family protein [Hyphomicrobiales bacterium]NRB14612.1 aminoglycoside phosphotransferase family protein [Hyphomicrobiales bacterium]